MNISSKSILYVTVFTLGFVFQPTPENAEAAGIVGDGTPGSCTEAALDTALTGGGAVTFACGDDPVTIQITSEKIIALETTMNGAGRITLDANGSTRFLTINTTIPFTLSNLKFQGGSAADNGGAILNNGIITVNHCSFLNNTAPTSGGALIKNSTAIINNSTFTNNSASSYGGAILNNNGTITVHNCTFTTNQTSGSASSGGGAFANINGSASIDICIFENNNALAGGAILNNGTLSMIDSTLAGNSATTFGGAIRSIGTLTISRNTLSGNSALTGGGLYSNGAMSLVLNTFDGNTAAPSNNGGGIYSNSTAGSTILSCTISGNTGGGIMEQSSGGLSVKNTILSSNTGYNCSGSLTSIGHNLESAATCNFSSIGDISGTNPLLAALADNGGPTKTRALSQGSLAIDTGTDCSSLDQRGVARPQLIACDIGAYEYQETGVASGKFYVIPQATGGGTVILLK